MEEEPVPSNDAPDGFDDAPPAPPRPLEDSVLMAAQKDVNLALRQTFWCSNAGLQACRAALALAKRGYNVNQLFVFFARGGCGLSLFTDLIAYNLGEELHKFFDPYIFCDDEELRKSVELLACGIVFSGQERPSGKRRTITTARDAKRTWKSYLLQQDECRGLTKKLQVADRFGVEAGPPLHDCLFVERCDMLEDINGDV